MPRKRSPNGRPADAERDELLWLETYFIVFPRKRRPTLGQVEHTLAAANPHLKLDNLAADDEGLFQSLLVQSAEDHAAVEVSFEMGEAVIEQNLEWAKQLKKQLSPKQLQFLIAADARLDVAHFERVERGGRKSSAKVEPPKKAGPKRQEFGDEFDELADEFDDEFGGGGDFDEPELDDFDPTCLLTVVEALAGLTKGLTFDPAAGEVL